MRPSVVGPTLPGRDFGYLSRWIARGFAVVATDYVGLGTPGVMAYLDGKVEAHSVVDSVKAARARFASLSNRWGVIGQSQGGGAAVVTARYATEYGGVALDYRGAVATGVPGDTATTVCAEDFRSAVSGLGLGDMFRRPLLQIPNVYRLLNDYMGIPTSGYGRPLFIGQGTLDTEVPAPSALSLIAQLKANRVPVTLRIYNADHSGAVVESSAMR